LSREKLQNSALDQAGLLCMFSLHKPWRKEWFCLQCEPGPQVINLPGTAASLKLLPEDLPPVKKTGG
jgi:hypothetical protein